MDKPSVQHLERHLPAGVHVHDSYAVDETNNPVTVLGTMGQDPDAKQSISLKTWVIVALCCLAQMQKSVPFPLVPAHFLFEADSLRLHSTFLGIAPAANAYTIAGVLGADSSKRIWIVQAVRLSSLLYTSFSATDRRSFLPTARCTVNCHWAYHGHHLRCLWSPLRVRFSSPETPLLLSR
jgi:hypothetical protein